MKFTFRSVTYKYFSFYKEENRVIIRFFDKYCNMLFHALPLQTTKQHYKRIKKGKKL